MNSVQAPRLGPEHPLRKVVATSLARKGVPTRAPNGPAACWEATQFGLQKVKLFNALNEEGRTRVLTTLSRGQLEETYLVERSGLSYAARMVQLSESFDEMMSYGILAGEEAEHFHAVSSFLDVEPADPLANPLIPLLKETIDHGDRHLIVFVIQVVLEGWGLTHYHGLLDGCVDERLREVLKRILLDEAKHHGGGLLILKSLKPTPAQRDRALEILVPFIQLVQVGPQWVTGALEREYGHLSRTQRETVFRELEAERRAQATLDVLKRLVEADASGEIAQRLEAHGSFRAYTAEECAAL